MNQNKKNNIIIHNSVREIDKDAWNYIVRSSSVFYDYEWFELFEHLLGRPHYIAAYRNEALIGLIPGFIVSDPNTYLFHNHKDALFGRNEIDLMRCLKHQNRIGSWLFFNVLSKCSKILDPILNKILFPAYICISPRGYVGDFQFENEEVAEDILKTANSLCNEGIVKSVCFMWIPQQNKRANSILKRNGYNRLIGELEYSINVQWKTMEELICSLKAQKRKRYKDDMARFNKAEFTIKRWKGEDFVLKNIDRLTHLAQIHAADNGEILRDSEIRGVLLKLSRSMKERLYTISGEEKGKIIGFCMGLVKNGRLYPKFGGYDTDLSKNTSVHFNLDYYANMEKAIAEGHDSILFGSGDTGSKLTRGLIASKLECYYYLKENSNLRHLFKRYLGKLNDYKDKIYNSICGLNAWKTNGFVESQNIIFRRLDLDDLDELNDLEMVVWQNKAAKYEELRRRMACGPLSTHGAFIKGKLVGSVVFVETNFVDIMNKKWTDFISIFGVPKSGGDCLYIVSFTAHPCAPRGVGRALLSYASDECQRRKLKYLAYGSRVPMYSAHADHLTIEEYIEKVRAGELVDPVLSLANICGFKMGRPVENYYLDEYSKNYGVHVFKTMEN